MTDPTTADLSITKLVSGVAGSIVSLKFVQGTWIERALMCVGGASLSFYGTTPVYSWVQLTDAEGLIGFMIGLFGMAIVAKCYEVVQLIDAKQLSTDLWEWVKRKWGA